VPPHRRGPSGPFGGLDALGAIRWIVGAVPIQLLLLLPVLLLLSVLVSFLLLPPFEHSAAERDVQRHEIVCLGAPQLQ
jgi:hypothetical protein